MVSFVFGFV